MVVFVRIQRSWSAFGPAAEKRQTRQAITAEPMGTDLRSLDEAEHRPADVSSRNPGVARQGRVTTVDENPRFAHVPLRVVTNATCGPIGEETVP